MIVGRCNDFFFMVWLAAISHLKFEGIIMEKVTDEDLHQLLEDLLDLAEKLPEGGEISRIGFGMIGPE